MIVNLSTDYAFETNNVSTVESYKRGGGSYSVKLDGIELPFLISEASSKALRQIIEKTGHYHFIYPNVAVNLEKVTSVSKNDTFFAVYYPNGMYRAGSVDEDPAHINKIYKDLKTAIDAHGKKSAQAKAYNHAAAPASSAAAATQGSETSATATLDAAKADIDTMIGCDRAKREINENLAFVMLDRLKKEMGISAEPISRHMAYLGNPGTGKTTFARKVAAMYHAAGIIKENKLVEVTRKDIVGEYVGHTAPKIEKLIAEAKGGILFIDEAYDLMRKQSPNDFGQEVINTLVPAMENMRDDLIVIFAGYPEEIKELLTSNPGLQSRVANMVTFEDYSTNELEQIMQQMLDKRGLSISSDAAKQAVTVIEKAKADTDPKNFANARTVRNLVEQAEKALAMRLVAEGKLPCTVGSKKDMADILTIQAADLASVSVDVPGGKKAAVRNPVGYGTAGRNS